ncbi:MAG: hypothetical protein HY722_11865 [Planctomycetes bacterium]|nr:hypothetical protein [Planctomycetota bacterium]
MGTPSQADTAPPLPLATRSPPPGPHPTRMARHAPLALAVVATSTLLGGALAMLPLGYEAEGEVRARAGMAPPPFLDPRQALDPEVAEALSPDSAVPLAGRVEALPGGGDSVILRARDTDAVRCVDVLQAWLEILQGRDLRWRGEALSRRRDEVSARRKEVEARAAEAREALAAWRERHRIPDLGQVTADLLGRHAEIEARERQASFDAAAAEAAIVRLNAEWESQPREVAVRTLAHDPRQEEAARLEVELLGLLSRYTENYPLVRTQRERLRALQDLLAEAGQGRTEAADMSWRENPVRQDLLVRRAGLQAEVVAHRARTAAYRHARQSLEERLGEMPRLHAEGEALEAERAEREAEVAAVRSTLARLSPAEEPVEGALEWAREPRGARGLTPPLGPSLLGGAVLGGILAAAVTWRRTRRGPLMEAGEASALTGLDVLGRVPRAGRFPVPAEALTAWRPLAAAIEEALVARGRRSVLLASALPGEGRTTAALHLALVAALRGRRTLLVSADLRDRAGDARPLERLLRGPVRPRGLTEFLTGAATLREVVRSTAVEGVHLLTAGAAMEHSSRLLGSQRMVDALRRLEEVFDLVILDGPSVLSTGDAARLAGGAGGLVLLGVHDRTPSRSLEEAAVRLAESGAHLLGLALRGGGAGIPIGGGP